MAAKKLIAWDHNRDLIYQRAATVLNDKDAAKYVWGIGFHWYEPWTGGTMQFENVKRVAETFPGKQLIFTEGCAESFNLAKINEWWLGEKYGRSMINDFNAGTAGWTDWNVFLDETGGPNHVGNFCFCARTRRYQDRPDYIYKFLLLHRAVFKIHPGRVPRELSVLPAGVNY